MTAGYEHNFDIGHFGILTPHVEVQHKSAFDLTFVPKDDTTGYASQEAYFLYNASLGFVSSSQKWSVNAVVKNITNYAVKKNYTNQGPDQYLMLGDPRTWSVTASVKF
jgi:hypothetical protein